MRELNVKEITAAVAKLCCDACYYLPQDLLEKFKASRDTEESPLGREVLETIIENAELAARKDVPLCQDTGLAVVFLEIGQEVHFTGGALEEAVNAGVAEGYTKGYLRKSSVDDPLFERKNTQDNTPAIIHTRLVDGVQGVIDFVLDTVRKAGPNPCPPVTVGVGIGGNMEKCALLAKYSLTRPIGEHNSDERYAKLEEELLERINKTGIGPAGLGGTTTAAAVNIEYAPTHIGALPVAVNLNCHAARRAYAVL